MKIRIIAGFVMAVLALAGLVLVTTYVGAADARALDDQEPREGQHGHHEAGDDADLHGVLPEVEGMGMRELVDAKRL